MRSRNRLERLEELMGRYSPTTYDFSAWTNGELKELINTIETGQDIPKNQERKLKISEKS